MSEIVGKKIKALPEATTAEDTDVMVIEDGTKTRKIGFGVLRRLLGIDTINNNLDGKSDKTHNHDGVYFKKTGGTISGNVVVSGTINDNRGNLVSAGTSNSVAIVWSSAMRFDVYVDNTFVGTLTPVK